mgnify:FL=1
MAVIVSEKVNFGDGDVTLKVFLPKGKITKSEREKAERLDQFLSKRMPEIETEMVSDSTINAAALVKWHSLGKRLKFVEDTSLVEPSDLHDGRIWLALRMHCPLSLKPKGEQENSDDGHVRGKREGKKNDHFELCYRLGKFKCEEINWISTWTEWVDVAEAPGLMNDDRIMPVIAERAQSIDSMVVRRQFRNIIKELRQDFPMQQKKIDSSGMAVNEIRKRVALAFERALENEPIK